MTRTIFAALAGAAMLISAPAAAQANFDEVEIKAQEVAPGVAVLFGLGGNIGVRFGEDGTVLIDDQFAPLTEKIESAVAGLGAKPVEYVINTHWHFDHTGGNENHGKKGATIIAHDEVRARMLSGGNILGNDYAPSPKAALPVVTFDQGLTLHANGDTIDVIYTGGGHTDGDSIVFWREKNVVHMGDLYIVIDSFPFVDVNSGGSVYNLMATLDLAIAMTDAETIVVPGHGPVSNRAEMIAYRKVVGESVALIEELHEKGLSLDEAKAAQPLAAFGRDKSFIGPDAFITAVWANIEAR